MFFAAISFLGINHIGKIEIVSLEPKDQKCELPKFKYKITKNFMISNLDEEIHLYDGNFRIYKLSKVNFTWTQVAKLGKKLEKQGKILYYFGCF